MLQKRTVENRQALLPAVLCACAVALLLFNGGWGELFSFDALATLPAGPVPTEAIVITMDETTFGDTNLNKRYEYPKFDRETHAKFLNKLKSDGARLVVFDIFFKNPQVEDGVLAAAITNHGNVVIAGGGLEQLSPEFGGFHTNDPAKAFLNLRGCRIGLPEVDPSVVRTFPLELEYRPSVALAAARAWGAVVDARPKDERWVAYYGDRGELPTETYRNAQDPQAHPAGYYKGKAIFIGGKPKIKILGEPADEFNTPLTRWSGQKMRGVEVHATMFLNLIRNEWVTRLQGWKEFALILVFGIVFGSLFPFFKPAGGLILLAIGVLGVSIAAILFFWTQRVWFNWLVIGWIEIPLAWATSAVIYSRVLVREKESLKHEKESLEHEKESLKHELESIRSGQRSQPPVVPPQPKVPAAAALVNVQPVTIIEGERVVIRDFDLLSKIGEGAYGQVWLARNLVGTYRAIKIVFRKKLPEQRPFEREFEGVRNFERISREHPGWVPILHVGKDDAGGFFYYVMDPADDMSSGQSINPTTYLPKTLGRMLVNDHYLSVDECVDLGIHLADALASLHREKFVHRDIKPSNIIFANDKPRLADIGLVAPFDQFGTLVGTPGFIPTEGTGTERADIFSLGRLLYMAATGCPPDRHPSLPTSLGERNDARELMQLMQVINKACAPIAGDRYETADLLHVDLVNLQARFAEAHV